MDNLMKKVRSGSSLRNFWVMIPPWIILGALLVLIPIFAFITLGNIHRENELTTRLLIEKGEALIRSFEAGARAGAGLEWGSVQLQKLLIETARQPGVDYLIIADTQGVIVADSDPSMVGEIYGWNLDLRAAARRTSAAWRRIADDQGTHTFEVYRGLSSPGSPFPGFQERADLPDSRGADDRAPENAGQPRGYVIFVGLDMGPVLAAQGQDTRNAVITGVSLLLIGFAGMVSLLLAQGYRSVRGSLSRARAFSDSLVNHMPIGLVAMDPGKRIIAFNETAEALFGLPAGDVLGRTAEEALPDIITETTEGLGKAQQILEREAECPVNRERTIPLSVIATRLQDDEGNFFGYAILFRDLTEVQHLKRELEHNRRLAAIGSLASGVAHEIRNPLSSIKGFATYLRERYRDNPEDLQVTDIMIQEVERMNRVIGQLLEFSRPLTLNRKEAAIEPILRHALKMIEVQAREKGVSLEADFGRTVPDLLLDSDRMTQVFLNLTLNALNAMEKGGTLSLRVVQSGDRTVRVDVSDTGTGIGKEELGRIFDPYFTTRPSGTGLGLPIAQRIVEAHGGEILVSSEPGRGTVFSVLLPRREASSEPIEMELSS
ncbi:MAG: Sensor protein ZraS [Syntrophus sp. PtaU1.Bin005]|nr:MAG: Sensor protein ZraS [Syntrophus sp. PtaU1.Bin005]